MGVKNVVADLFSRLLDATKVPIADVLAISDDRDSEADHSERTPLPAHVYDLIAGSFGIKGRRPIFSARLLLEFSGDILGSFVNYIWMTLSFSVKLKRSLSENVDKIL